MENQRKPVDKVVIIVHGFMSNEKASWVRGLKNLIQDIEDTTAVMVRFRKHVICFDLIINQQLTNAHKNMIFSITKFLI